VSELQYKSPLTVSEPAGFEKVTPTDTAGYSYMYDSQERKSFKARLKSGKRWAKILCHQHEIEPFLFEFVLTLMVDIDEARFKRRLRDLNPGLDMVVFVERSQRAERNHYAGLIRNPSSKADFKKYLCECLAPRKTRWKEFATGYIDLHFEGIEDEYFAYLARYSAKAEYQHLRKNKLSLKGVRDVFTVGKPWSKPTSELVKNTWEENERWLLNVRLSDPYFDHTYQVDDVTGNFKWKYFNGWL